MASPPTSTVVTRATLIAIQAAISSSPQSRPVAQNPRANSGIILLNQLQSNSPKWQQRPETPALISRIHTSSSHHAPHQCSDSAEEWIRPVANHPTRRLELTASVHASSLSLRLQRPCSRLVPFVRSLSAQAQLSYPISSTSAGTNQTSCLSKGNAPAAPHPHLPFR